MTNMKSLFVVRFIKILNITATRSLLGSRVFLDNVKKIILTGDKTVVQGDILIDDKPSVTGINPKPTWDHINYGSEVCPDWLAIEDMFLKN
jgi:hypothetical protein